MRKRLLSALLALCMVLTLLPGTAWAANETTMPELDEEKKEFYITTVAELTWIAAQVSSGNSLEDYTVILKENIDLSGIIWVGIGYNLNNYFAGVFDGNGHTISGLTANGSIDSFSIINAPRHSVGLFGVCVDATVKNLVIENSSVSISNESGYQNSYTSISGTDVFGASVCGYAANSTFENITVRNSQVSVYTGGESGRSYAGGIVAYASLCDFAYCANESGTVSGTTQSLIANAYAGGIVGYYLNAGTIRQCSNTANISTDSGYSNGYAGGIVGMSESSNSSDTLSSIRDSYNKGQVSHIGSGYLYSAYVGGIIGYSSSTVNRCYNAGAVSANSGLLGDRYLAGISSRGISSSSVSNSAMMATTISGGTSNTVIAGTGTKENNIASSSSPGTNDADANYAQEEFYGRTLYEDVLLWDFDNIWSAQEDDFPKLRPISEKIEDDIIIVSEATEQVQILFQEGSRDSYDRVTQNVTYTKPTNGAVVVWSSSNETVVSSSDGTVIRQEEDYQVIITATISSGEYSVKKRFVLNVIGNANYEDINPEIEGMTIDNARSLVALMRGCKFKDVAVDDEDVLVLTGENTNESALIETMARVLEAMGIPGENEYLKSQMGDVMKLIKSGQDSEMASLVSDFSDGWVSYKASSGAAELDIGTVAQNIIKIPNAYFGMKMNYVAGYKAMKGLGDFSFKESAIATTVGYGEKLGKVVDYVHNLNSSTPWKVGVAKVFSWINTISTGFQLYDAFNIAKQNAAKAYIDMYLKNRDAFESADDEIFQLIMSAHVVSSIKTDVDNIDEVAESLYQLNRFLGGTSDEYKVTIMCPVDVVVYDSTGKIVGRVINNEIDRTIKNSLLITVGGDNYDEKTIYIEDGDIYIISLIGNDMGSMDIDINAESKDGSSTFAYRDIALEIGKTMLFEINLGYTQSEAPIISVIEDGIETDEIESVNATSDKYTLTVHPVYENAAGEKQLSTIGGYCQFDYVEAGVDIFSLIKVNDGYTLDGLYKDIDCTQSFEASIMPMAPIVLYAKFIEQEPAPPVTTTYTVTVNASPAEGGNVTGAGTYNEGDSVTVEATPANGYHFVRWMENGSEASTNTTYTFNITVDRTLTAVFELGQEPEPPAPATYTVTVNASPTAGGSVTGGGIYDEGESATVKATPANGYRFVRWTENGQQVSTSATYTFNATANRTLTAVFERISSGGSGGGSYVPTPSNPSYQITVSTTSNGTVTVTPTSAKSGAKVTITATPDSGYMVGNVTVKDSSGNGISVTDNGDGTYTFTMPASQATVTVTFATVGIPWVNLFTDVSENDWFYDGVAYVAQNGLMQGVGGGKFNPSGTTTRGMIVTILYRLENEPTVSQPTFTDVAAGQYYTEAVAWAAVNKIVEGYGNNTFGPNDDITREQMATILYRYATYKNYDVSGQADLSSYADTGSISSWALTAMRWANNEDLIGGRTATTLAPKGTATRAEAAVILSRFCQSVAGLE